MQNVPSIAFAEHTFGGDTNDAKVQFLEAMFTAASIVRIHMDTRQLNTLGGAPTVMLPRDLYFWAQARIATPRNERDTICSVMDDLLRHHRGIKCMRIE